MTLDAEVLENIDTLVRSACEPYDRLAEIVTDEMYEPGQLDPAEVQVAIDRALAGLAEEQKSWPTVTDSERLDRVFAAMRDRNIIAIQDAGFTQSDGYDDFRTALDEHPERSRVVGYCFFHGQDRERAIRGGGLFLAFGPTHPQDEDDRGEAVGRIVAEQLAEGGFRVVWNGTFGQRIHIPEFVWRRRVQRPA